jgi:triosephosphate isomerase
LRSVYPLYRNGNVESITSIIKNLNSANLDSSAEVVISPPALYLLLAREVADKEKLGVSAQNVFDKPNGAFTGEISVQQLREAEINWTILGHSERRVILKETDEVRTNGHIIVLW